jgi:predicted amidophosphoribosyltransferase
MSEPDIFKIACSSCQGHIEFPKELHGQVTICPHCGLSTVLRVPGHEPEKIVIPPPLRHGTIISKKSNSLGDKMLVVITLLLAITIIGIPVAIIFFLIANSSKSFFCSECGSKLSGKTVKLCPGCKVQFK